MSTTVLAPFPAATRRISALVVCGLLASCGGDAPSGDGATTASTPAASTSGVVGQSQAVSSVTLRKASDTWIPIPVVADPLLQNLAIPADAPTRGMWSDSKPWPLNAIHASLMPDGRLLTFGTPYNNPAAQDGRFYDIWNPSLGFGAGSHASSTTADPVNSFCSTATWQLDGRLLVAGGNGNGGKSSGLFTTSTLTTTDTGSSLAAERWYSTMLTLPDGRSLILGGTVPYGTPITSQTPEVRENGQWRSLFGASSTPIFGVRQLDNQPEANPWYYPRSWVAPDGSIFGITSNIMFRMRPDDNNRNGSIARIGTFKTAQDTTGATTPNVGFTSAAVMFAPGRILQVGGNGVTDNSPNLASQQATVIDINGAAPVVTETAPMSYRRYWLQATVLPAGQVVATGGTSIGWEPANASRPAEIWDPATGRWTVGASNVETRSYHSSGLLLPNGTVFTAGGGAPGQVNNLNAEIYYPPQLFRTVNGTAQLAERPVLRSVSTLSGVYGDALGIALASDAALSQVTLVALGNVTHSFNSTQRRIPLQFAQAGAEVQATLPASANLAPPGYYMVFAIDANGVASRATVISLGGLPAPTLSGFSQIPATATACAGENGTCAIPAGQRASVYYGVGGSFALRSGLSGNVNCGNDTFGDPAPGFGKSCSYVLETAGDAVAPFATPVIGAGAAASYAPGSVAGATYSWTFGDGTAPTAFVANPATSHVFANAGVYSVTLTMRTAAGAVSSRTFLQAVGSSATAGRPAASSAMALEPRNGAAARLWIANPDSDTVAVVDTATNARVAEIAVGVSPRSVAVAPDGRIWVVNKASAAITILNPATLGVAATVALPRASQPHGLVFAPGGSAYVVLEALGQLLKLDPGNGATQATLNVGTNPRHLSVTGDGATVLVSRFITAPLPGEGTATINTATGGAEVWVVGTAAMTLNRTVVLRHSDKVDAEQQGAGLPNYLAAATISPDGRSAWVPSKQDNVRRGALRSGQGLDFQNTVRAISSRIDMASLAEDYARRVDHDNSSLGTAAAFHPSGAYLFVALETSRQVAVVDAAGGRELAKFDVGRAPQAIAVSADGNRVFVQNFMDRTVSMLDMSRLTTLGQLDTAATVTVATSAADKLSAQVLSGKQLFYDARDPRLARDSYMSCASCHSDAGHDGRTWDFTGFGEGLRNTIALKGRAGTGHGFLHWSANFDEVQDFEAQIRTLAGGTGLMSDAQFNTGSRAQPLGDRKAGASADLDALAAYLGSLDAFAPSPLRNADASLTTAAQAGKTVFAAAACASCHAGAPFTISAGAASLRNVGTLRTTSGQRLGANLAGIDVPTLRDVWATAPYLHDGSAPTLAAAVQAHSGTNLGAGDLANLVAYLQQIGGEESAAPAAGGGGTGGTGGTGGGGTGGSGGSTTPAAVPPATATACGAENQTCTIPAGGTATVWYGANGQWAVKTGVAGAIGCNNAVFGDPVPGTVKACRYALDAPVKATTNLAPSATLATSYVSPWESLAAVNNGVAPANSADRNGGAYGNWQGEANYGRTDWVSFTWAKPQALSALEVYWWNDGMGIGTPTAASVEYWNGAAWQSVGAVGTALDTFNRAALGVTTTRLRVSMKSARATGILEARVLGAEAPTPVNLAASATLATSYVSPWESLPAVANGIAPANSADRNGGAYGNWQGEALYNRTDWVSFTWSAPKSLSALEVYWWNDGMGIATPTGASAEFWDGKGWQPLPAPGTALDAFNRIDFQVTTTAVRVSMRSARATGILEARVLGADAPQ